MYIQYTLFGDLIGVIGLEELAWELRNVKAPSDVVTLAGITYHNILSLSQYCCVRVTYHIIIVVETPPLGGYWPVTANNIVSLPVCCRESLFAG